MYAYFYFFFVYFCHLPLIPLVSLLSFKLNFIYFFLCFFRLFHYPLYSLYFIFLFYPLNYFSLHLFFSLHIFTFFSSFFPCTFLLYIAPYFCVSVFISIISQFILFICSVYFSSLSLLLPFHFFSQPSFLSHS